MIIGQMATHFVAVVHLLREQPRLYKRYILALNKKISSNQELFSGFMIAAFDVSPSHQINLPAEFFLAIKNAYLLISVLPLYFGKGLRTIETWTNLRIQSQ
jgi:hypothetical protein